MKDALFILSFGLLIYFASATILGDTALMGSYGATFASYNHHLFGYVSYVYILASLLPLYIFYKHNPSRIKKVELTLASFLTFFSLLLAQALLVTDEFRGALGAGFVDTLSPNIGTFGLWIFWFIITLLSMVIFFEKSAHEMLELLYIKLKSTRTAPKEETPKKAPAKKSKELDVAALYAKAHQEQEPSPAPKIQPQESKETPQESASAMLQTQEESLSESSQNAKNILHLVHEIKEQKGTIVVEELEENAKLLATIEKGEVEKPKNFKLPSVEFLQKPNTKAHSVDESELDGKIKFLIEKLAHFKIEGDVVRTYAGPVVSTFEFKPAANVKVSRILNLQDDLAMALSAETIRIQAPIPGKDVVGIEIPNEKIDTIYLRELLDSKLFKESASPLTIVLGKDIVGKPFVTDLKKLPHLLIAGTTGSGKSVGINAMILSLLYKNSPDQLRLLMIDPKMLEFSIYNDIPHLLTPVITKAKQAIVALNNMVYEMERRYALMSDNRTKNIESYNEKVKKDGGENLPYIVVIIDELADLMMTSGKDVEYSIARLAQMARASGIHLVVATQRPSVDVVTGLIKANLPSRISYRVGQKVDSKIILDQQGAESLLGKGDMLFTPPGSTGLVRLHAPWSTEEEIEKIVDFIKSQRAPNYDKSFLVEDSEAATASMGESYEELDPMFEEAKSVVLADRKTSISYLQRKLQIGYNKSARLIEQLEHEGILTPPNAKGIRDII